MIKKALVAISIIYLLLIWIFQSSVNSYYELTYQKTSPLKQLDSYRIWNFGKQIKEHVDNFVIYINNKFSDVNKNLSKKYNQQILNITLDAANKEVHQDQKELDNLINNLNKQETTEEVNKKVPEIIDNIAGELDYRNFSSETFKDFLQQQLIIAPDEQVLFIGDSLQQGIAPHTRALLSKKHKIKSIDLSTQSTGLVYTDFFNWNKTLIETLDTNHKIRVVVIMLGANDQKNMKNELKNYHGKYLLFNSKKWQEAYEQRVMSLIYNAYIRNVKVIWLQLPNMRKEELNQAIISIRNIQEQAVKQYAAINIDTNKIFSINDNHQYISHQLINGKNLRIRTKDGIHFDIDGQKILAKEIIKYITFANNEQTQLK